MLYEIKVVLKEIDPLIWRLIQVPPRTNLKKLHRILQIAMGWTNSHLHLFKVGGKQYGEPDPEWDYVLDEANLTLEKIFAGGTKSFLRFPEQTGPLFRSQSGPLFRSQSGPA